MDPHTERYESINPYLYAFNNPARFIDIKGRDPGDIIILFTGANIGWASQQGPTPVIDRLMQDFAPLRKDFTISVQYHTQYNLGDDESVADAMDAIDHSLRINPKAKIVIYGYSYGGVLANYLAKKLDEANVKVDLLVTVDAANGQGSNKVNRKISKNVKKNLNYFQKNKARSFLGRIVGSHGDKNIESTPGQVVNNDMSGAMYGGQSVDHSTMDEATEGTVANAILNFFNSVQDGKKTISGDELKKQINNQ
ncbi:hypothetical protein CLV57_0494 [Mucilaginibacter auburnensis]|uniref:Uncharacterized protein n=1 Tax=Mucilaginibacter auburnensis TaxID=1457233 RepID=A0A2H9VRS3_9SPHI|nr:hypothetical protein CLV57_0494 [Mucilaginibacter auburnensis]